MPDINQLPSSVSTVSTQVTVSTKLYRHPKDFPEDDLKSMRKDMRSNILLPYAEKILKKEQQGQRFSASDDQFWIGCYTLRAGRPRVLDFFLSCTDGPIGKYPIFIHTVRHMNKIDQQYLLARMRCLVDEVTRLTSARRVFSVFAIEPVAEVFTSLYFEVVGVPRVREPYYAALFTYCTRTSFRSQDTVADIHNISIRKATVEDVPRAARLCHGFAAESEPFFLSRENALREATILQQEKQLWVLETSNQIASIVCVTREDCDTSAITKVYTSEEWRGRKLAECLVREVCKQLLSNPKKKRVVLFVAHDNKPAAKVYHRVGFVGLAEDDQDPLRVVEPWTEIGFDRKKVDLGHW